MTKILKILAVPIILVTVICLSQRDANAGSPNDIIIVANKSFPVSSLSAAEIKRLFLKEKSTVKGKKVTPINAKINSSLRKQFATQILGMSHSAEIAYWVKQKLSKGTSEPTELSNTIKAVFSIKNSISYCYRKDFNGAVAKRIAIK